MRLEISPYGEASDIAVPIGQSITVTSAGDGVTTIFLRTANLNRPLAYQQLQTLIDAEVTLGPYAAVRYFKINADAVVVYYEVDTAITADNAATFPSVLADDAAAMATAGYGPLINQIPAIGLFGDSISWMGTKYFPWLYDSGYITWGLGLGKFDYRYILNFGVPGDRVAAMLLRINDVINSAATVVVVMGGTNDAYASVTAASYLTTITSICDQLRAARKYVFFMATPPTTRASAAAATTNLILDYNGAAKTYWDAHPAQGKFVDCFASSADSTVANSPWKTGASSDTPDVVHPNDLGGYYLGTPLATAFSGVLPLRKLVNSPNDTKTVNANSNNSLLNPCFLGTTGALGTGMTGASGVATNWNTLAGGSASGVCSKIDSPDGVGKGQQIVWTFTASGEFGYLYSDELSANVTAGHYYQVDMLIDVSSPTNAGSMDVYFQANYTHTLTNTSAVASSGTTNAIIPVSSVTALYVGQAITYVNSAATAENRTITAISGLFLTLDKPTAGIANGTTITAITDSHWGIFDTDRPQQPLPAYQVVAVTPPAIYAPNPGSVSMRVWTRIRGLGAGGATVKYSRASLRDLGGAAP